MNASTSGGKSELPPELRRFVDAVRRLTIGEGMPPTLEEIADLLGCAKSTASKYRKRLHGLGVVQFDLRRRRSTRITAEFSILATYGLDPVSPPDSNITNLARFRSRRVRLGGIRAGHSLDTFRGERPWRLPDRPTLRLPVAGPISAGPARTFYPDEDSIEVHAELTGPGQYALRVRGDSMVALGIFDGDQAIVDTRQPAHHGDLVAALLPDEQGDEDLASLKVFEFRDGEAWLVAANAAYAPIPLKECTLLGRVTTIIRRF
jgi:SOS-response transcriptional repressor LexA